MNFFFASIRANGVKDHKNRWTSTRRYCLSFQQNEYKGNFSPIKWQTYIFVMFANFADSLFLNHFDPSHKVCGCCSPSCTKFSFVHFRRARTSCICGVFNLYSYFQKRKKTVFQEFGKSSFVDYESHHSQEPKHSWKRKAYMRSTKKSFIFHAIKKQGWNKKFFRKIYITAFCHNLAYVWHYLCTVNIGKYMERHSAERNHIRKNITWHGEDTRVCEWCRYV